MPLGATQEPAEALPLAFSVSPTRKACKALLGALCAYPQPWEEEQQSRKGDKSLLRVCVGSDTAGVCGDTR